MLKTNLVIFLLVFLLFGCTSKLNPLNYSEAYLESKIVKDCKEGTSIDTYLLDGNQTKVKVQILQDSAQFCWVKYEAEGLIYNAGYDKNSSRLCRYEATAPGFRKSNSLACSNVSAIFGTK